MTTIAATTQIQLAPPLAREMGSLPGGAGADPWGADCASAAAGNTHVVSAAVRSAVQPASIRLSLSRPPLGHVRHAAPRAQASPAAVAAGRAGDREAGR